MIDIPKTGWYSNLSIKKKIFFTTLTLSISIIFIYSVYTYYTVGNDYDEALKSKLISGAFSTHLILGDKFHDRISTASSISPEENLSNIYSLNQISENLGFTYVYTIVKDNDKIVFTGSSATKEEFQKPDLPIFFEEYKDAPDELLETFRTGKMHFAQFSDKWGTYNSVFIPFTTSSGKTYVVGDISTKQVTAALHNILIKVILSGVFFLFLIALLVNYSANQISKPVLNLAETAKKVSQGNLNLSFQSKYNDETGLLAKTLETMVSHIKENITDLENEKKSVEIKVNDAVKNSEEQNRYLEKSVNILFDAMDRLAGGDLTVSIVPEKEDMIGKLFNKFNNVISNISSLLGNIKLAVDDLGNASNQIAGSSKQIAAGTQDQFQQIQNASGAVEEMARSINDSTQFSINASESSRLASNSAKKGAVKVQDTKQGMLKIVHSTKTTGEKITLLANQSDQIGEIAQVINDIADQTNLLALNAAIEAARAGEQGRGFAVVADEVRKLAERTTKATKEIADTIKNIQNEAKEADSSMSVAEQAVLEGMQLTEEVAITLEEMLSKNDQVSDMINMVADAGKKQSAAAGNMSKNIEEISAVTLQSANGTELIAQSAEDLNHLAQNLQNLVMKFKLIENGNKFASKKLTY